MKYGIGIDTGGTFTDSVIVDFNERRLVSKAKALTTKQDLRIGILNSLAALDNSLFSDVKLVSLSTTLATNSVVEGKGSRVGLIIAVPHDDGTPPYIVKWQSDGHIAMVVPDQHTRVERAGERPALP